jgi:hypothetical protein
MKSALYFIERWIKISGYTYRHDKSDDDKNRHRYLIQHDMGIKWSIYLANLYQFLFDELNKNTNKKRIQFDETKNTLAFTVDID